MAGSTPYVFVSHASADNARLRPVLVRLLDSGIPIWFDKPYHPAIDLEEARFHGYIKGGGEWAESIDDFALPDSSVFLVFSSPATVRSEVCTNELYSALSRHRTTSSRYRIAPCLLDADALTHTHESIRRFQGYSTAVREGADGWELTEGGVGEVDRMIVELKADLAAFATSPLVVQRDALRFGKDDAYLVDRIKQSDGARVALQMTAQGEGAPTPLFITYGMEDEEPRCFNSVTLPRRVVMQAGIAAHAKASDDPLALRWPETAARNAAEFSILLTGALAMELQGASQRRGGGGPPTPLTIAEALRQEGIARIAVSRLPSAGDPAIRSLKDFITCLRVWSAYWNEFPFAAARAEGRPTLVPLLEIAFVREQEAFQDLKRRLSTARDGKQRASLRKDMAILKVRARIEREIRRWLSNTKRVEAVCKGCAHVRLKVLQELESIRPAHAEEWVLNDPAFAQWRQADRNQLRTQLMSVFDGAADLPMRAWAEKARPYLKV